VQNDSSKLKSQSVRCATFREFKVIFWEKENENLLLQQVKVIGFLPSWENLQGKEIVLPWEAKASDWHHCPWEVIFRVCRGILIWSVI
jgi:hypothetical protein